MVHYNYAWDYRPYIFYDSINTQPIFQQLTGIECQSAYFQQDSVTAYSPAETLTLINEIFEDRANSRGLWPSRSSDFLACDFYLGRNLKFKYTKDNTHTICGLKDSIVRELRRTCTCKCQFLSQMSGMCCSRGTLVNNMNVAILIADYSDSSGARSPGTSSADAGLACRLVP